MPTRLLGYIDVVVTNPRRMTLAVLLDKLLKLQRCIVFIEDEYFVYQLTLQDGNKFDLHMFSHGKIEDEVKFPAHLRVKRMQLIKAFQATLAEVQREL